ncbi:MAG: hypothetical protein EOP32_39190 [Rhodococcus sp. (in: high G+C Gram-positive bacteria)]|nr:MAG: hypothetical protein EOP32_39190 [Rhodococcus sp. (in: high G+C Gram-positive bacteria)]
MGRQSGIFGVVGLIVGVMAVVVFAAFTSRPYTMATSFQPGWTDPSIVSVIVLGGGAVAGAGCGVVLWLSGWRMMRDEASADERRRRRTFLLGRTVAAALGGVTVGLLPLLVLLYVVFTATVGIAVEWASVLVLYTGSGVLAYGCALVGVWWVLAAAGDDRRAGTVRMLCGRRWDVRVFHRPCDVRVRRHGGGRRADGHRGVGSGADPDPGPGRRYRHRVTAA